MRYSDFATEAEALDHSVDMLKAIARNWSPSGVAVDGFEYPEGEWPGEPVGSGRHCRPEIGIATHAVPVEKGDKRLAGRFLVRDDTGIEIADDEIKREPAVMTQ